MSILRHFFLSWQPLAWGSMTPGLCNVHIKACFLILADPARDSMTPGLCNVHIKACFLILAAPRKGFHDSMSLGDTKESKYSSVQWMIQFLRARFLGKALLIFLKGWIHLSSYKLSTR